jgi:hypothetical protein
MYETNWDLWQNWMNPITVRFPVSNRCSWCR